jgi:hypothetical protein
MSKTLWTFKSKEERDFFLKRSDLFWNSVSATAGGWAVLLLKSDKINEKSACLAAVCLLLAALTYFIGTMFGRSILRGNIVSDEDGKGKEG